MSQEKKEENLKTEICGNKASCKISSIGGQALMEGVMMRGKNAMAMAVRSPDGDILLETKRLKGSKWYNKVPVIRGVASFILSMVSGVDTLMKSASVSAPEEDVPSKGWMGIAVVLGLLLGVGLFILLPSFLASLIFETFFKLNNSILFSSLFEGLLRIIIFVVYLLLTSRLKDIKRTFMYHGAEHKTINAYEKGLELNVQNVQSCSTRHNRCGTTFLFFVMMFSILLFSVANYLFSLMGINSDNYNKAALIFIKFGIRLALLPLIAGLSFELLKFLAKLPDNAFTNILRAPGLALQRLTTYPPTDDMAEVALVSFNAALAMDNDPNIKEVKFGEYSIGEIKKMIAGELKDTTADSSEADWILCDVFKVKRGEINKLEKAGLQDYRKIKEILKKRKTGMPLAYVLGFTDFYGLRLKINKDVLIPRPETELLAELAIKQILAMEKTENAEKIKALDLCTGSGCIAKAIAMNTSAEVTASDISGGAVELAAFNLKDKAKVIKSDMFEAFSEHDKFNIIISNPPYIKTYDIDTLQAEVKDFEPRLALDGGQDGLNFYRKIAELAPKFLIENGGTLYLEIGYNQAAEVAELLKQGFNTVEVFKDYSGHDRIIKVTK